MNIDLTKLGGAFAKGAVNLSLSFIPGGEVLKKLVETFQSQAGESLNEVTEAISRERTKIYIEQVQFLEQFQDKFANLIKTHVAPKRLVVFVDDLDRCLPEKAIEVLEAIKLFLDAEHCVFILGLDQEVISRGIEMKYKELGAKQDGDGGQKFTIEGVRYLEKIIQLPFQIPPVEQTDMDDFVNGLSTDWPHKDCPKVFSKGLGDNPRQIKRTVNTFLMLWKLAEKRKNKLKDRIKPLRLAKVVAIQAALPDLYNLLLKEEPRYLRELEEYYRSQIELQNIYEELDTLSQKIPEEAINVKEVIPPPALSPFLSLKGNIAVRRILLMHNPDVPDASFINMSNNELKLYFTLTTRIESPQATSIIESMELVFEPQTIKIPSGVFLMGTTYEEGIQLTKGFTSENQIEWEQPQHTIELPEYFIGKYPTTNREYQIFVSGTKYKSPQGWNGEQFPVGKGSHPVVNVSWDDANAYCKWLSEKTGKSYCLPTEAEWKKAARGIDGNIWSWGNVFDKEKANTAESKINDTTEVGKFSPQGDSPYGCVDVIGNVWEWTSTLWGDTWNTPKYRYPYQAKDGRENYGASPNVLRVLRGGSFKRNNWEARCAIRNTDIPRDFSEYIGFRVALSPIKLESWE